jgi:hypothetical protein
MEIRIRTTEKSKSLCYHRGEEISIGGEVGITGVQVKRVEVGIPTQK